MRAASLADLCCCCSENLDSASFLSFLVVFFSESKAAASVASDVASVPGPPGVPSEFPAARRFARFCRRASSTFRSVCDTFSSIATRRADPEIWSPGKGGSLVAWECVPGSVSAEKATRQCSGLTLETGTTGWAWCAVRRIKRRFCHSRYVLPLIRHFSFGVLLSFLCQSRRCANQASHPCFCSQINDFHNVREPLALLSRVENGLSLVDNPRRALKTVDSYGWWRCMFLGVNQHPGLWINQMFCNADVSNSLVQSSP